MTHLSHAPLLTHTAADTARTFSRAVVDADERSLHVLLTDDVWFRCLLPRGVVEHHDRDGALETILGWFGQATRSRVAALHHHSSGVREHVGWRVLLRPEWAPETWHLIEQLGYVRVDGPRIRRVDLVCTGFQPQDPVADLIKA